MTKANVIRGRIQAHGKGFGEPTEEDVRARASEIAIANGRSGTRPTETDLAEAREELAGSQNGPDTSSPVTEAETLPFPDAAIGEGPTKAAPTRMATDEQAVAANLVRDGVDEAAHEQLVEGNKESRRKDERYEDQLLDNM